MIIVEGMDNTGKTTLIAELVKEFPELQTVKSLGPNKTVGDALAWVAGAIRNEDPRVIYDRYFPISERVYGLTLRGKDLFGHYSYDLISLTLRRQPLIIYCRPSQRVVESWGEREQMEGVKSHCHDLLKRYDWIMEVIKELYTVNAMMVDYDYTDDKSFNHVKMAVRMYLQTHKMILPAKASAASIN